MPRKKEHRNDIFYVRLKQTNKDWMYKTAEATGYASVSAFTDNLIQTLREKQKVRKTNAGKKQRAA